LKTFDGEDLRKVLLSSGTLLVHTERRPEGEGAHGPHLA
jgi:hypothetical protein